MAVRLVAILLLSATACGCTPRLIAPESYTERARAGTILLEGSTLTIKDGKAFVYERWSDDLSSGRYGAGVYQLLGCRLRLQFNESSPVTAQAQAALLVPESDSLVVTFTVLGPAPGGQEGLAPVPGGAVVTGRAADGRVLAAVTSNEDGRAKLVFARTALPARLQAEHLGLVTWRQACPAASTDYLVSLPPVQGTPYAAGTVKEFRVRRLTTQRLVVSQGKRKLSLVRQAPAR